MQNVTFIFLWTTYIVVLVFPAYWTFAVWIYCLWYNAIELQQVPVKKMKERILWRIFQVTLFIDFAQKLLLLSPP